MDTIHAYSERDAGKTCTIASVLKKVDKIQIIYADICTKKILNNRPNYCENNRNSIECAVKSGYNTSQYDA